MNGIQFIRENGGLGRTLAGGDHLSGLLIYGETAHAPVLLHHVQEAEKAGITSDSHPVAHYHIAEFFRIGGASQLYVQILADSDDDFTAVKTLQSFAQGGLRQLGVCDFKRAVTTLEATTKKLNALAQDLAGENTPLSVVLSLKITTDNMVALPDLHTMNAERVSVVLGQDGGGRGAFIAQTSASLSCVGAVLGAIAKARVHESIAWVEAQNMVSLAYPQKLTGGSPKALELDVPAFCDGSLLSAYTPEQVKSIHDKGYLFLRKHTGITGSYANDSFTATGLDSDFAYLENNRAVDKAVRRVSRILTPKIASPMYIDPDNGRLDPASVSGLESLCEDGLQEMVRMGELSGFAVNINPEQAVLKNSKLEINLQLIPVGTLRKITVKMGLGLKTK